MPCPPWQLSAAAPDTVLRGSTKRASLTRIAWVRGWGDEPVPVVGVRVGFGWSCVYTERAPRLAGVLPSPSVLCVLLHSPADVSGGT